MKYRVIVGWNQIHKFSNYSEALEFSQKTRGTIYKQVIY